MPVKKQLKIIRCTDGMMWYSNKIGELVPFVSDDNKVYWSKEDAGYLNIVLKEDAEVVLC